MKNCFMCNTVHNKDNYLLCENLIKTIIKNYINIDIQLYHEEIKKYASIKIKTKNRNKKYQCEKCLVILSSYKNYINHTENNVCEKKSKKCIRCNRTFANNRNLGYHLEKNVCGFSDESNDNMPNTTNTPNISNTPNIPNIPNIANINNMTNSQNTTTNIGTLTNNNNNNIQINVSANAGDDLKKVVELLPFREMGYKITTEKYLEYATNPEKAIKQFIKENHFNPDKPERMNVLNTNRRDNRVQLFDYDDDFIARWQTKDKAKIIELLYDRGMNHLFFAKMMLDGAGIKLDAKKEAKLKEKLKEYEDDKVKKKCLDMISDMTYDYRDMVEENKKNIEKQQKLIEN